MVETTYEIKIPKPLVEFGFDQIQVQQKVVEWLALSLFTQDRVSSGKAAQLLNITRIQFLALLRQYGIAYINYDENELLEEFQAVEALTVRPTS
ncbi:UPF0175 family protein [Anaerolineales bacterium HSG25]|nr:UPF0175 family protein [Anaerolineales bacterium HSG25]